MRLPGNAANSLNIPIQAVEAMIKIGIHEKRLVRVGDRIFTASAMEAIVAKLHAEFADRYFHPRDLRNLLGYSRLWTDQLSDTLVNQGHLLKGEDGWKLEQRYER